MIAPKNNGTYYKSITRQCHVQLCKKDVENILSIAVTYDLAIIKLALQMQAQESR